MNKDKEFEGWAMSHPFPVPMSDLHVARKAWDACWNLWDPQHTKFLEERVAQLEKKLWDLSCTLAEMKQSEERKDVRNK
jgi:hypothetical protein